MNPSTPKPVDDAVENVPRLVLIHDALGSPLEFAALTQILGARAVPFDFIEIPGYTHGSSRPMLAWRKWLRAASDLLDARYDARAPIVLGGLGTGAALAAALALEARPQRVCGVALLSPTFTRDGPAAAASPLMRLATTLRFDPWISVAKREPFGVKNQKTRRWVAGELAERGVSSIGPARTPLRAVRESARLHAHVRASLAALSSPLLVLHATDDEFTSLASVTALVAGLGDRARLIALEHSHHMITIDNDRQRVAHELADFIGAPKREPAGPLPTPSANGRARTRSPKYAAA